MNARIKLLCRFIEISATEKFLVNNLNDRNSAMNELLKSCKVYTQIAIQHLLKNHVHCLSVAVRVFSLLPCETVQCLRFCFVIILKAIYFL